MSKNRLTAKQKRFVDEYLIDLNATQAAIRAGYSAKTAEWIGPQLLGKTHVAEAIAERMKEREARTGITQDMVLERWWKIATADPNDLIQYRRVCCRHCHGHGFGFQWVDEAEFDRALAAASAAKDKQPAVLPTNVGGFGFNPTLDPRADCPKCNGEGIGEPFVQDTRKLKGAAKLLYAGVKVTKEGLEVKMHDQMKALELVGRHLGMLKEKVEMTGKDGGPVIGAMPKLEIVLNRHELTDEELERIAAGKQ
jgi:phage terminase small subunit